MSRIDDLIAKHCPGGVSFERLGTLVERSTNIRWLEVEHEEYQYIDLTSVDRVTHSISSTETIRSDNAPSRAQQIVREGDVLFGTTRPMLKRYCVVPTVYDGQIASTGYCVLRPKIDRILTNYLFHMLGTAEFYEFVEANERGASYPAIPDSVVKAFRIPVPPLEVQHEIVQILDHFTELEAELVVELEARRRQYAHYRDSLLTLSGDVEWSTLGGISARVSSGGTPSSDRTEYYGGDIPWLRTQEVDYVDICSTGLTITEEGLRNSSAKWIPANCVIVAMYGATAAKVAINTIPLTTNQACCNLQIDESQAEYRYVFHWISKEYERLKSLGEGSQSNLNAQRVKNYPIPLPTLPEQKRIVSILDSFDALVNDLSIGLPAELAARRKQYEYYRDRLLTFEELAS